MSTSLDEQIRQLKQAITELESQRPILGDAAVEAALVPSRQKLAELESQESGTRLSQTGHAEFGGFFKIAEGLVGKQIEKQAVADFDALKLVLEEGQV